MNFSVKEYIEDYFSYQGQYVEVISSPPFVYVDMKQEEFTKHNSMCKKMDEMGFEWIEEVEYDYIAEGVYSSKHTFKLRDKEKISEDMEIIRGQDHDYWIYNNDTDMYYPTSESWNAMEENEFVEVFNTIGFTLYGNQWIKEPDFDI